MTTRGETIGLVATRPWQVGGVRFAEDARNKPLVTKLLGALSAPIANIMT